jgi:hypothetical protein
MACAAQWLRLRPSRRSSAGGIAASGPITTLIDPAARLAAEYADTFNPRFFVGDGWPFV